MFHLRYFPVYLLIPFVVDMCGKSEAQKECSMRIQDLKSSTRYWNYVEDYCPCAGGLSAVNAIGTRLRSNTLGTDPRAYGGLE